MKEVYLIFMFITGSIFGSFINMLIYRLPKNLSIIHPPSHCPTCGKKLKFWQNIPIISYLILKGRCYYCKNKIPIRYLLVEIICGTTFVLLYLKAKNHIELIHMLIFSLILTTVTFIDLEHLIIPDELNIVLLIIGSVFSLTNSSITDLKGAVIGGIAALAIMLAIYLTSKGKMGFGDVKLLGAIGVNIGYKLVLLSFFIAVFTGSLVGIVLILTGMKSRKDPLPFGPFLSLGAIMSLLIGDRILKFYEILIGQ
ncbi:MAG: prepilin peptidase [Thermosulfidibacteraceae bacterium]|jgi:leader peptidase (prepilin peptidase)/N-methyltransferase